MKEAFEFSSNVDNLYRIKSVAKAFAASRLSVFDSLLSCICLNNSAEKDFIVIIDAIIMLIFGQINHSNLCRPFTEVQFGLSRTNLSPIP